MSMNMTINLLNGQPYCNLDRKLPSLMIKTNRPNNNYNAFPLHADLRMWLESVQCII